MRLFKPRIVFLLVAATLTACGGGGSPVALRTASPRVTPPPVPSATPTAMPGPASVATTQSLNNGMALSNAPLAIPLAVPTGYSDTLTIPLVTAAAGTTLTIAGGAAVPPGLVPLSVARLASTRRPDATSSLATIYYDSIVPSANVTLAGNINFTQSFPANTLTNGASYYVAFFDTTQTAPVWQTISGPVLPSGSDLTFSGTISPTTLIAGKTYGFAIFSGATPTATPPPAPQTLLYFSDKTGLTIATETGSIVKKLNIPSQTFDIDDAGNVYANDPHHGGTAPGVGGADFFAEYPAGSETPNAPYLPSTPRGFFTSVSGAGEVIAVHNVSNAGVLATDIWDPGVTGAPSRTITTNVPTGVISFVLTHDGTLYVPDRSSAGVPQFDVFPPGATTPSKVIPETILPAAQYNNFSPNYSAVGADGTLYVTEYSFQQPDPNSGIYIYPLNGPERFIAAASNAQGPGPQGIDVDGSGNIYVVNNNTAVLTSTTCQGDSLQSVTVYDQKGNLLRTVTGNPLGGFPITAAVDGTAFVSSFRAQLQPACPVTGIDGIFSIAPGASTSTQISSSGSSTIVLYDGTHRTEPFGRPSHGSSVSGGHANASFDRRH